MENSPVITLNGFSPYPGVDPEVWERWGKWGTEVYAPLMMKYPARRGIYSYRIVKENPVYPVHLGLHHHENLTTQQNTYKQPEQNAILKDSMSWDERKVVDHNWSAIYQLIKGFRNNAALPGEKPDTTIADAPLMHIEAYKLTSEEQEKYNRWFIEYGMNVFIPLFMKQTLVKGYDYFKYTGLQVRHDAREPDYPSYLALIYFENMQAFEKYEKSPELTTFQKTMRNVFPRGVNYRWYVQYQLTFSLRK